MQCQIHQNDYKNSEKYKAWYQEHSPHCTINFEGSSGAKECEAGVEKWLRSIEKNILQYTTFVGDGDSSCFWRVKEACFQKYPDGSYPVNKEECVGHIQKRMGSGLREYKKRMRGQKLPDGKNVGGAGRLTDAVIDRIQSNYGEAIRNNSEIGTMKTTISGVYHHMIKDEKMTLVQQHKHCPMNKSTWCKFWQDKLHNHGNYTEDSRIPEVFKSELKYLFDRLSHETLLQRCLKGLTQNQNESINNMLWSICSKRTFCGYRKLLLCVYETVTKFNQGAIMKSVLMKNIGCEPKHYMTNALQREDGQRIDFSERKISEKRRSSRQKQRLDRKRKKVDKTAYLSGGFGVSAVPDSTLSKKEVTIRFTDEETLLFSKNGFLVFVL